MTCKIWTDKQDLFICAEETRGTIKKHASAKFPGNKIHELSEIVSEYERLASGVRLAFDSEP